MTPVACIGGSASAQITRIPGHGVSGTRTRDDQYVQLGIQRLSETSQDRQTGNGATRFEASDGRLPHRGSIRQLCLAPTALFPQLANGPSEFVGSPRRLIRLSGPGFVHAASLQRGPIHMYTHHSPCCLVHLRTFPPNHLMFMVRCWRTAAGVGTSLVRAWPSRVLETVTGTAHTADLPARPDAPPATC